MRTSTWLPSLFQPLPVDSLGGFGECLLWIAIVLDDAVHRLLHLLLDEVVSIDPRTIRGPSGGDNRNELGFELRCFRPFLSDVASSTHGHSAGLVNGLN